MWGGRKKAALFTGLAEKYVNSRSYGNKPVSSK